MARYIDADALKDKITDIDGGCAIDGTGFDIYTCEVFELIDEVPAADVVEVVRCKDCLYYKCLMIMGSMPRKMCSEFNWQSKPYDFCSLGKRIKNE